jgi:hypothetical protein
MAWLHVRPEAVVQLQDSEPPRAQPPHTPDAAAAAATAAAGAGDSRAAAAAWAGGAEAQAPLLELRPTNAGRLVAALLRTLLASRARKLAAVAAADPPLFARLVRALAQLAPGHPTLWTEVQRLSLAALLQAEGEAAARSAREEGSAWEGALRARLWGSAGAREVPLPDASLSDLANLAFGLANANAAAPPLLAALRGAALAALAHGPQPADPHALSDLLWAWVRAKAAPGPLVRSARAVHGTATSARGTHAAQPLPVPHSRPERTLEPGALAGATASAAGPRRI